MNSGLDWNPEPVQRWSNEAGPGGTAPCSSRPPSPPRTRRLGARVPTPPRNRPFLNRPRSVPMRSPHRARASAAGPRWPDCAWSPGAGRAGGRSASSATGVTGCRRRCIGAPVAGPRRARRPRRSPAATLPTPVRPRRRTTRARSRPRPGVRDLGRGRPGPASEADPDRSQRVALGRSDTGGDRERGSLGQGRARERRIDPFRTWSDLDTGPDRPCEVEPGVGSLPADVRDQADREREAAPARNGQASHGNHELLTHACKVLRLVGVCR